MALLTGALAAFYGRLLFSLGGYLSWGNYGLPLSPDQFNPAAFAWNPYFLNGSLVFLPPQTILIELTKTLPILALTILVGFSAATKLYVLLSTLFMAATFYYLCRVWGTSSTGTFLATLLFTFSPLALRSVAGGDFVQFVSVGFLILSIAFLVRFVQFDLRLNRLLLYSVVMLALAAGTIQITLIGSALFFAVGIYLVLERRRFEPNRVARPLLLFFGKSVIVLPIFAFILVPLIFGGASYSSGSLTALALRAFAGRSVSVLSMLTFSAYAPATAWDGVERTFGPRASVLWSLLEAAMFLGILLSPLLLRAPRQLFSALVILTSAIFGAGTAGPAGALVAYLYVNLPGYAALNSPWFWLIGPIAIFYGLMAGRIVDALLSLGRGTAQPSGKKRRSPWRFGIESTFARRRDARNFRLILVAVVLLVLLLPIVSQGYYRTDNTTVIGIVSNPLPADYSAMYEKARELAAPDQTGVAFFNPDRWAYLTNQTDQFNQPFVQFPLVRTPGLPYYGVPSLPSNYYFYWLYQLFYSNGTRYLGGLMGLEGMSVFVSLYGLNPASFPNFLSNSYDVNASPLMSYQADVAPVTAAKDYAIYADPYLVPAASPYTTTTTVLGDFGSLNRMAYAGWNLTRQAIRFPGDVGGPGFPASLNGTDALVLGNANELLDLVLPASGAAYVNPLDYVSQTKGPDSTWSNSLRDYGLPVLGASPGPVAFTTSRDVLSLPLDVNASGTYQLWAKVYRGPQAGTMAFSIQGQVSQINAAIPDRGQFNSFVWTPFNLSLLAGAANLTIRSSGGWSAVQSVYLGYPSRVRQTERALESYLVAQHIPVTLSEDPSTLPLGGNQTAEVLNTNAGSPNASFVSLPASTNGSSLLTIQAPTLSGSGKLWLLLGGNSSGKLVVSTAQGPPGFLNFTPSRSTGPQTWSWHSFNVSSSAMITPINLTLQNGSLKLGDIEYVPTSLAGAVASANGAGGYPVSGTAGGVVPVSVPIQYDPSGYAVDAGCSNTSLLVRSSFSAALAPSAGEAYTYPMMGGSDTGISRPSGCGQVNLVAQAWTAALVGIAISVVSATVVWLLPVIPRLVRGHTSWRRRITTGARDDGRQPVAGSGIRP